jgi:hypothetical protein
MKRIRLRVLPDRPRNAAAPMPVHGFPIAGEAVVIEVFPVNGMEVMFNGKFGGRQHSYHYFAEHEKIAARIRDLSSPM